MGKQKFIFILIYFIQKNSKPEFYDLFVKKRPKKKYQKNESLRQR